MRKRKKITGIRITSKRAPLIKVTSKRAPLIDAREIAKALGAEIVTDPKKIAEFRKKFPRRPR